MVVGRYCRSSVGSFAVATDGIRRLGCRVPTRSAQEQGQCVCERCFLEWTGTGVDEVSHLYSNGLAGKLILRSAGWNIGKGSILARHEWKNLSKLGHSLEDWVAKDKSEKMESRSKTGTSSMPGTWDDNLDDEEEWIEEDDDENEEW